LVFEQPAPAWPTKIGNFFITDSLLVLCFHKCLYGECRSQKCCLFQVTSYIINQLTRARSSAKYIVHARAVPDKPYGRSGICHGHRAFGEPALEAWLWTMFMINLNHAWLWLTFWIRLNSYVDDIQRYNHPSWMVMLIIFNAITIQVWWLSW
jgi:hypothetical protein